MAKRVYFIGIGGISMSSLAVFLAAKGNIVCGSDIFEGENFSSLKAFNIPYHIGHSKNNIKNFNPNLVVVNCAIHSDNEEFQWAVKHNKKIVSRAQLLGKISKEFKNVIAIGGTHGKTTTTAIISEIFIEAAQHPTVHIGGVLKRCGSNFLIGDRKFFITEACEYQNSFLELEPTVGIALNVEPDHLDFFKDIEEIQESFNKFLEKSKTKIFKKSEFEYTLKNEKIEKVFEAKEIRKLPKGFAFDLYETGSFVATIQTPFFGVHNVKNTIVACAVALFYKIKIQTIKKAIRNFHGVKRRFEEITKLGETIVIHDYAHHPTEISKTIAQAKQYGKVLTVFQPHTFSRTKKLFEEFLSCFDETNGLMLFKTYPARELESEGTSAKQLYSALVSKKSPQHEFGQIKQKTETDNFGQFEHVFSNDKFGQFEQNYTQENLLLYCETFEQAKDAIFKIAKFFDCILILGAGDINELAYLLKRERKNYLKER